MENKLPEKTEIEKVLKGDTRISIAAIIIFSGIMQVHSIEYWQRHAGYGPGIAWSLGLEAAVLYLWYRGRHKPWFKDWLVLFKIGMAFLLISGPWYQLAGPAIKKLEEKYTLSAQVQWAEEILLQRRKSLASDEANSNKREGWAKRIDNVRADVKSAEAALEKANKALSDYSFDWRLYFTSLMMAFALAGILFTNLVAVISLPMENKNIKRKNQPLAEKEIEKKTETVKPEISKNGKQEISEIRQTAKHGIENMLKSYQYQKDLCADLEGISQKDISCLLNDKPMSKKAVNRIYEQCKQVG